MKEKTWPIVMRAFLAACRGSSSAPAPARRFAPSRPQISVRSSTSTLGSARMRSTRYCDMVASRLLPAHHHPELSSPGRREDHRLAGGIARADQRHFLPGAEPGLDRRWPSNARRCLRSPTDWRCPAGDSARPLASTTLLACTLSPLPSLRRKRAPSSAAAPALALPREWRSRRRISAPGYRPAPSAPCRKCRWESPDNSRSATRRPPGRQSCGSPAPGCESPSDAA